MFYDSGYWYYEERGTIVRNDIEGKQYTVVVKGNNLKIKSLNNGVLTYTDEEETYTIEVEMERSKKNIEMNGVEKLISNYMKVLFENIKSKDDDVCKKRMENKKTNTLKCLINKTICEETAICLEKEKKCNEREITAFYKENANGIVNENKEIKLVNKNWGIQDGLVLGSARGQLYFFKMMEQN